MTALLITSITDWFHRTKDFRQNCCEIEKAKQEKFLKTVWTTGHPISSQGPPQSDGFSYFKL